MTKVMIVPVPSEVGRTTYVAVAGDKQSLGATAGAALDALASQLEEEETGTVVILQNMRPDMFFSARQQRQLSTLMDEWRTARDTGSTLSAAKQSELEALVEAELIASTRRTTALLDEISQ